MKRFLVLLLLVSSLDAYSQKIHSPAEILRIMVGSATKYQLDPLDKEIKPPNYSSKLNINDYYREEVDGKNKVLAYKLDPAAESYFMIAEVYFSKGKMDSALMCYKQAYELDSSAYKALTYIGQCYLLMNKLDDAEPVLKKAIEKNYIDYMAHWFLSDIYAAKSKWKEAAREITIASVLNRNNPRILTRVAELYKKAKLEWHEFTFNPQIKLVDLGGTDSVKVGYEKTWMMYAMTKAVWAFEYQYKESMGEKDKEFSVMEEVESLAVEYQAIKNAELDIDDYPELIALVAAVEAKMLYPYIYYEIMFPKYPFTAYVTPKDEIERIADYVMKIRTWKD